MRHFNPYLLSALAATIALIASCSEKRTKTNYDFTTVFEHSEGLETATYKEVITYYDKLSEAYTDIAMYELSQTDSGKPLHLVTFNPDRSFESEFANDENKVVMLINNGIHPGESDGIDASMMLMRDLAEGTLKTPENVIIAVIPVYNIGGALNRNSGTRTNQNGPKAYGFRGNARNYDLNRDFIKMDSKNARSFARVFHNVSPDVFIDTHVSNGADYQYVLTHLFTQHNKLGGPLGDYLHKNLMPQLEDSLQQRDWDITPYVNVFNRTPESGFQQFMDSPRYSTGYTTLFNTLGMMVETHMLKPYKERVEGTYALLQSMIEIVDRDAEVILELRKNSNSLYSAGNTYPIQWQVDSTRADTLDFRGYEGVTKKSDVTGANRLQYDRNQPFTKKIPYNNYFEPKKSITIPEAYVVPKGYWNVIDRLRINKIKMRSIPKDTTVTATIYRIEDYETVDRPYEGHYLHYNSEVSASTTEVKVNAGDYWIDTQQPGVRFLLETLEPEAPDSYFNWNYFDAILQQKEGFSPYVWEEKALELLNNDADLKARFEEKKKQDPTFAQNWYAQLDWLHKQSDHYETSHLRYPIVRVGG
ncbi:M14 family metallopeptidase [Flavobacteriaceae bacterium TK19130]|nr:M14 family metallopeptidase [Thermobacterium salinum]